MMSCSWANLPPDLLLSIADNLDVTTSTRLSAVYRWASTMRPCLPSFHPFCRDPPIPWLLCSAKNSNMNPNHTDLTFYDLSTATNYSVRIPIPLLFEHHWLGSYKGWLVTLDRQLQLHLIKPLTGAHVLLPSKGIEKEHPKKVILWQNADNTNKLQAFCLTHQGHLASAKLGDDTWTWMVNYDGFTDIAVYQGRFYAVSMQLLCYWNLGSSSTDRSVYFLAPVRQWTKYLLEWNGELLMLVIEKEEMVRLENQASKITEVGLYKILVPRNHGCSISCVKSLGDDALFLGVNSSYTVSSSGRDDIQGNCIYFTNQISRCFHNAETSHPNYNFGRFDLGKQTYYKPCCPKDHSSMHLPPPILFWPC